jgi:hypothetical protein
MWGRPAEMTGFMNWGFGQRLSRLLGRVDFEGLSFEASLEDGRDPTLKDARWYLRVVCPDGSSLGVCSQTGIPLGWQGRKWRLSPYMTDGEIVQTALKAVLTAMEHEVRERFQFDGVSVFDPHFDIHKLVALRKGSDGGLEVRGSSEALAVSK